MNTEVNVDVLRDLLSKSLRSFDSIAIEASFFVVNTLAKSMIARSAEGGPVAEMKTLSSTSPRQDGQQPSTWRVWWRKPDCWRADFSFASGGKASTVICKGVMSHYLPNSPTVHTTQGPIGALDRLRWALSRNDMMDRRPAIERVQDMPLLGNTFASEAWELRAGSISSHCSRKGFGFDAMWRGSGEPTTVWPWISHYRGIVDADRGILLECAGLIDGEEAVRVSAVSVSFDPVLPDAVFVADAPEGTRTVRARS